MLNTFPISNLKQVPIIENSEKAREYIDIKHEPFLLQGYDIGSCKQKWTPDYLASLIGTEEVKVHISKFSTLDFLQKNFSYITLPFDKMVKHAANQSFAEKSNTDSEFYYLRSLGRDPRKDVADIRYQFPQLSGDINFPHLIPKEKIFSSVFRIASKDVSIWTHYDVMDNMLIQIKGRKKAVLFPPNQALNLYLNGDKSEVIDIDTPDLKKFPKFQNITRYECIMEPGDILYIPSLWFHNMKYLDFGIAVNIFWKELDQEFYDKKDPYGNKDLLLAQQAFRMVDKAFNFLSNLPKEYEDFYCRRLIAQIEKKIQNCSISEK